MPKCNICGSETNLNYGNSTEIVCKECAGKNPIVNNVVATWLKLLFIVSTLSAVFMFFASQGSNFDMAIITFIVGTATILIFFGIAEIINQLVQLNEKFNSNKDN